MAQTIYPKGVFLQTATIELTSNQLLHMLASPITCIAAPGANKIICVVNATFYLFFGTTPYTIAGAPKLTYQNNVGFTACNLAAGIFTSAADFIYGPATGTNLNTGSTAVTSLVNQPIVLSKTSSEMTLGDGTARLVIQYSIVDVAAAS